MVVAAACGNSAPSEGALAGKTATAITGISVTAFHRQSSVQFVYKTVVGEDDHHRVRGHQCSGNAAENVTANGQPVTQAVLVDHVAYVRAVAAVLDHSFDLSSSMASAYSGKWISLQTGDADYQGVVNSISPTQAIAQFVPEEPHLRVRRRDDGGQRGVVAVSGELGGSVAPG